MLAGLKKALWGNLTQDEFKRFGILSSVFLFIIGSYWLLRGIKDGIFSYTVGVEYIPKAKMGTILILFPLVLGYSKLVDLVEKHVLFYILCSAYFVLFTGLAIALANPVTGIQNTETSPYRIVGWVTYFGIETFGSLIVALFWSFVASTSDSASAKKGYALIIAGAQFGSIAGPSLLWLPKQLGFESFQAPVLFAIGAFCIALVPLLIKLFVSKYPNTSKELVPAKKTGILEGLFLLFSHPYLMGVLAVSSLYEIVGTILDYQMKVAAKASFASPSDFMEFMGMFGTAANGLALVFALVGTGYFIRRFGLTFCLTMFPVTLAGVVAMVWITPNITSSASILLWTLFAAMIAVKGLSYALNNPCKEMMYIPTSKDVKFKAKGWMDNFGGRTAKAAGSGITDLFKNSPADLMIYGSLISLGIIGAWIAIALFVGRTNKKLTDSGTIIS